MSVAVIDTGTNSTRLLVAEVQAGIVSELERRTTVTRLGKGVDADGRLQPAARERVSDCVDVYAERISRLGALRTVVLATSSIRDASDGADFLAGLAESHDFEWRLLSGEEEALLSFSGATLGTSAAGKVTVFDVGGGSTEVVTALNGAIVFACSLPIGCVRLSERFLKSDPVASDELAEAAAFIDSLIAGELAPIQLSGKDNSAEDVTVAVAGTATALAAMDLGLEKYDRDLVHDHVMSIARIGELLHSLAAMTVSQKLAIPTMEAGRADVIVAGGLVLERLLKFTGAKALIISENDILDGAALAIAAGRL